MKTTDIITSDIDRLGLLLAEIDRLSKEAESIKDNLKDIAILPEGQHEFIGNLFRALVVEADRKVVNYKKLFADLQITEEVVAKYTKTTPVISVKTTAR
jgi:hypothetical protein